MAGALHTAPVWLTFPPRPWNALHKPEAGSVPCRQRTFPTVRASRLLGGRLEVPPCVVYMGFFFGVETWARKPSSTKPRQRPQGLRWWGTAAIAATSCTSLSNAAISPRNTPHASGKRALPVRSAQKSVMQSMLSGWGWSLSGAAKSLATGGIAGCRAAISASTGLRT